MLIRWYRQFSCWLNGHQCTIITGRLKDHTGQWITKRCLWCDHTWQEPIPNNRTPHP